MYFSLSFVAVATNGSKWNHVAKQVCSSLNRKSLFRFIDDRRTTATTNVMNKHNDNILAELNYELKIDEVTSVWCWFSLVFALRLRSK